MAETSVSSEKNIGIVEKVPFAKPVGSVSTSQAAKNESANYERVVFEEKEYENLACLCEKIFCCLKRDIHAMPDEIELKEESCICCSSSKKVPYGELSGVGEDKFCCFIGFSTGSLTIAEDGCGNYIYPGSGCNAVYVMEIVEELKARQYHRGDVGIQRMLELQAISIERIEGKLDALLSIERIEGKLDALLARHNVAVPSDVASDMQR